MARRPSSGGIAGTPRAKVATWSISIGFPVIPLNRCISQPVLSIQIVRSAASNATSLTCGDASSMACPRVCNSRATLSAAIATSDTILVIGEMVCSAQRQRFVGSLPVTANGISGPGIGQGSPAAGPQTESSTAAASRTVRVSTNSVFKPPYSVSSCWGPLDTRPRLGLSPTSPQQAAGIRMDPPASVP